MLKSVRLPAGVKGGYVPRHRIRIFLLLSSRLPLFCYFFLIFIVQQIDYNFSLPPVVQRDLGWMNLRTIIEPGASMAMRFVRDPTSRAAEMPFGVMNDHSNQIFLQRAMCSMSSWVVERSSVCSSQGDVMPKG